MGAFESIEGLSHGIVPALKHTVVESVSRCKTTVISSTPAIVLRE